MRSNVPEMFQKIALANNFKIDHILIKEEKSNKNPFEYVLIFEKS